jgi:hypothetical protein
MSRGQDVQPLPMVDLPTTPRGQHLQPLPHGEPVRLHHKLTMEDIRPGNTRMSMGDNSLGSMCQLVWPLLASGYHYYPPGAPWMAGGPAAAVSFARGPNDGTLWSPASLLGIPYTAISGWICGQDFPAAQADRLQKLQRGAGRQSHAACPIHGCDD